MFTVQASTTTPAGLSVYGSGQAQKGQIARYVGVNGEIESAEILQVDTLPAGVWMGPTRLILPADAVAPAAGCQLQLSEAQGTSTLPSAA